MIESLNLLPYSDQILVFQQILQSSQLIPGFRWSVDELVKQLQQDSGLCLKEGDVPRAFVIWKDLGAEGELLCLASSPFYRRRGYMRVLLQHLFDANCHIERWWLEVHESNLGALNLYAKMGFEKVRERKGYYSDKATALILVKTITP